MGRNVWFTDNPRVNPALPRAEHICEPSGALYR